MNFTTMPKPDAESELSDLAKIERYHSQQAFIARGLASLEAAKKSGEYVSSEEVLRKLDEALAKTLKKAPK